MKLIKCDVCGKELNMHEGYIITKEEWKLIHKNIYGLIKEEI